MPDQTRELRHRRAGGVFVADVLPKLGQGEGGVGGEGGEGGEGDVMSSKKSFCSKKLEVELSVGSLKWEVACTVESGYQRWYIEANEAEMRTARLTWQHGRRSSTAAW